jgi:hypothetical protein
MICDRCDKPIRQGEKYEEIPIASPTGLGSTVVLHKELCGRSLPLRQTAPVDRETGRTI